MTTNELFEKTVDDYSDMFSKVDDSIFKDVLKQYVILKLVSLLKVSSSRLNLSDEESVKILETIISQLNEWTKLSNVA